MTSDAHRDRQIIDAFDPLVLREHFQMSRQALDYWRINGIPHVHRQSVKILAAAHGLPFNEEHKTAVTYFIRQKHVTGPIKLCVSYDIRLLLSKMQQYSPVTLEVLTKTRSGDFTNRFKEHFNEESLGNGWYRSTERLEAWLLK